MLIKELITKLEKCNPEARLCVIAMNGMYEFQLCALGENGTTFENSNIIGFFVDGLNNTSGKNPKESDLVIK